PVQPGHSHIGSRRLSAAEIDVDVDPAFELLRVVDTRASHALDDVAAGAPAALTSGGAEKHVTVESQRDVHVERSMSKDVAVLRPVAHRRLDPRIRLAGLLDYPLEVETAEIGF